MNIGTIEDRRRQGTTALQREIFNDNATIEYDFFHFSTQYVNTERLKNRHKIRQNSRNQD